jgi:hypothetical protein
MYFGASLDAARHYQAQSGVLYWTSPTLVVARAEVKEF